MWFGNMPASTGDEREKISLRKQGDYNSGIKTLSKNPNPNYTLTSLSPRIEKPFSNYSILWYTISLREHHIYIELRFAAQGN